MKPETASKIVLSTIFLIYYNALHSWFRRNGELTYSTAHDTKMLTEQNNSIYNIALSRCQILGLGGVVYKIQTLSKGQSKEFREKSTPKCSSYCANLVKDIFDYLNSPKIKFFVHTASTSSTLSVIHLITITNYQKSHTYFRLEIIRCMIFFW